MNRTFRTEQDRASRMRPPRGYVRWLAFWGAALLRAHAGLVWAEDEAAALLLRGFPALLAVPAALFADTARLFPKRCRFAAAGKNEEELLAALHALEERFGVKYDWDLFLSRADRCGRHAMRLRALSSWIGSLAAPEIDTRSPLAAIRSVSKRNGTI